MRHKSCHQQDLSVFGFTIWPCLSSLIFLTHLHLRCLAQYCWRLLVLMCVQKYIQFGSVLLFDCCCVYDLYCLEYTIFLLVVFVCDLFRQHTIPDDSKFLAMSSIYHLFQLHISGASRCCKTTSHSVNENSLWEGNVFQPRQNLPKYSKSTECVLFHLQARCSKLLASNCLLQSDSAVLSIGLRVTH